VKKITVASLILSALACIFLGVNYFYPAVFPIALDRIKYPDSELHLVDVIKLGPQEAFTLRDFAAKSGSAKPVGVVHPNKMRFNGDIVSSFMDKAEPAVGDETLYIYQAGSGPSYAGFIYNVNRRSTQISFAQFIQVLQYEGNSGVKTAFLSVDIVDKDGILQAVGAKLTDMGDYGVWDIGFTEVVYPEAPTPPHVAEGLFFL